MTSCLIASSNKHVIAIVVNGRPFPIEQRRRAGQHHMKKEIAGWRAEQQAERRAGWMFFDDESHADGRCDEEGIGTYGSL